MPGFDIRHMSVFEDRTYDGDLFDADDCKTSMPIDYRSYLLAASPPGFDLHYGFRTPFPRYLDTSKSAPKVVRASVESTDNYEHSRPCGINPKKCLIDFPSIPETESENIEQKKPTEKNGKMVKRVSFADDLGGPLVRIRLLSERPDSPPTLNPDLFSSLTIGSSASITHQPPLKLIFSQPASDYVNFRKRLETANVALENVILNDYRLVGTVKVKNIAFEKRVIIRHTMDSWESFEDTEASYVRSNTCDNLPFDTFSFGIDISPKMDIKNKFEFSVKYIVNDEEHWDNNSGINYSIVSSRWEEGIEDSQNTTDSVVYDLHHSDSWTEFCGWSNMSSSMPYY